MEKNILSETLTVHIVENSIHNEVPFDRNRKGGRYMNIAWSSGVEQHLNGMIFIVTQIEPA